MWAACKDNNMQQQDNPLCHLLPNNVHSAAAASKWLNLRPLAQLQPHSGTFRAVSSLLPAHEISHHCQ